MVQWRDASEVEQDWSAAKPQEKPEGKEPDSLELLSAESEAVTDPGEGEAQPPAPAEEGGQALQWQEPEAVEAAWQSTGAADKTAEDDSGMFSDLGKGVVEGLGLIGGQALQGAPVLGEMADEYLPAYAGLNLPRRLWESVGVDIKPVDETMAYKAGDWLKNASTFEGASDPSGMRLTGQIGGSVLGFGLTALTTGPGGVTGLGITSGAGDFYSEAKDYGADDEDAMEAATIGAGAGLTNVLPAGTLLRGLRRSGGKPTQRFLTGLMTNTATEAGQEAFYQWMKNTTARDWVGYDPNRSLTENLLQSATAGGGAGAFMYTIGRLSGVRVPGPPREKEIREAEEELRRERGLGPDDDLPMLELPPPEWSGEYVADPDGLLVPQTQSESEQRAQYREEVQRTMTDTGLTPDVRRAQQRLQDNIEEQKRQEAEMDDGEGGASSQPQTDFRSSIDAFRREADRLYEERRQRNEGKPRDQQENVGTLERLLDTLSSRGRIGPEDARELFDQAVELGRPDLSEFVTARAEAEVGNMETEPKVGRDSPNYEKIRQDLARRKAEAERAASELRSRQEAEMGDGEVQQALADAADTEAAPTLEEGQRVEGEEVPTLTDADQPLGDLQQQADQMREVEQAEAVDASPSDFSQAVAELDTADRTAIEQDISGIAEQTGMDLPSATQAYLNGLENAPASRRVDRSPEISAVVEALAEGMPRQGVIAERLRGAVSVEAGRVQDEKRTLPDEMVERLTKDREVEREQALTQERRDVDHVREVHQTPVEDNLTESERETLEELDARSYFEPETFTDRDWAKLEDLQAKAMGNEQTAGRRRWAPEEKDTLINDVEDGRSAERPDGVRFSSEDAQSAERTRGMATEAVQEIVNRIKKAWANAPAVVVVRRQRDLPARLRDRADRHPRTVRGLYDGETQTVYLIARNIDNARQATRVIFHEAIAHHGVRRSLGQRADAELLAMYNRHKREAEDIAAERRINTRGVDGKIAAAEELLSRYAEQRADRPGLTRIMDMLDSVANAIGLNLPRSDLRMMVANSARYLQGKRRKVEKRKAKKSPEQAIGDEALRRSLTQESLNRVNKNLEEAIGRIRGADEQIDAAELSAANDSFTRITDNMSTLLQITKRNPHIEGLQNYTELVRQWNNARMTWIQRANDTVMALEGLGPEKLNGLSDFIFDQTVAGEFFGDQRAAQYNLDEQQMEAYRRVRADFEDFISQMEEAHVRDIRRTHRGQEEDVIQKAISEARKEFSAMRSKPYFPLPRFGRYAVKAKAKEDLFFNGQAYFKGDTVWFRTYESKLQRTARGRKDIPGPLRDKVTVGQDYVSDVAQDMLAFPPQLREMVAKRMREVGQLTEAQEAQLRDLSNELSPDASFRNRMRRRKGVPGYNEDLLRGYASYFSSGANHIARTMFQNPLRDSIQQVRREAAAISSTGGDGTRRREIADHMEEHMGYNFNPDNEWAMLRSAGFHWYLGFSPRSAGINLTQVPMITYPYLAARYGDAGTAKQLTKAYKDLAKNLKEGADSLSSDEQASIDRAVQEGFIDESMASVLAGVAEGQNLDQSLSSGVTGRTLRSLSYYSTWMFTKVEQLNRRVSLLATYRLARERGASHERAYREGRAAVENTQYEYARWNRPKFMRGKKSVIFLFHQHIQNTASLMAGAEGGGVTARLWLTHIMAAGLLGGIPFMEDILDLVDGALSIMTGKKVDTRLSMRERSLKWGDHIEKELGSEWLAAPFNNPDLVLRGMSRQAFGVYDVSGSMSMGNVIPGTELFKPRGEMTKYQLMRMQEDAAGAVASIPMGMWQAVSSTNPDTWKRMESAMPNVLSSASMAIRRAYRGEETDYSGAVVREYPLQDPLSLAELLGRAAGAESTAIRQLRERERVQREHTNYWNTRRSMLLEQWDYLRRTGQEVKPVREAVRRFNKDVPFPEMKLTSDSIINSLKNRQQNRTKAERDMASQRQFRRMELDVSKAFPEVEDQ